MEVLLCRVCYVGCPVCDQLGSVVGAKFSMVMDDAVVGNPCTHYVTSALARDFNNGTLADDIPFLLRLFVRLNPASSMKMNWCSTAATSSSRTL